MKILPFISWYLDMSVVFRFFHVVESPVPHEEQAGDDHVREQSCAEECSDYDKFIVHVFHLLSFRAVLCESGYSICPDLDPGPDAVVLI